MLGDGHAGEGARHAGEGDRGADREVDAARDEDEHHAHGEDAEDGGVVQEVLDVPQREEAVIAELERDAQDHDEHEEAQLAEALPGADRRALAPFLL